MLLVSTLLSQPVLFYVALLYEKYIGKIEIRMAVHIISNPSPKLIIKCI